MNVRSLIRPVARVVTAPVGSVRGVRTTEPHAVLTFDDGPDPDGTEKVLAALAEHGATATFFVLLDRARRYRTLLAEAVAQGHEVALHGVDHRRLTTLPAAEVYQRTARGKAELEDLLGTPVRWFRPPFGAQSIGTWRAVKRCGLEPVVWGPTAWDWLDLPVDDLAKRAMERMSAGSVLLAHDGFAGDPDIAGDQPAPRFDRGELTTAVLDGLSDRALRGVSLADALRAGRLQRWAWFKS